MSYTSIIHTAPVIFGSHVTCSLNGHVWPKRSGDKRVNYENVKMHSNEQILNVIQQTCYRKYQFYL